MFALQFILPIVLQIKEATLLSHFPVQNIQKETLPSTEYPLSLQENQMCSTSS